MCGGGRQNKTKKKRLSRKKKKKKKKTKPSRKWFLKRRERVDMYLILPVPVVRRLRALYDQLSVFSFVNKKGKKKKNKKGKGYIFAF